VANKTEIAIARNTIKRDIALRGTCLTNAMSEKKQEGKKEGRKEVANN